MSVETFRTNAHRLLARMLEEAPHTRREELIHTYLDEFEELYITEAHQVLGQVLDDARLRLDARLSPDPVNQTIANVQTTVQDLFESLWREGTMPK